MKVITKEQAVALVSDGASLAVGGFVGCGHPEALTTALEQSFLANGHPRDLTLIYSAGQGDRKDRGMSHFAHRGMLRRVIGGHWNWSPKLGTMALNGDFEAYNLPQGVITHLFRAAASGQPGVITKTGLGTFVDPRQEGGRVNTSTREELVEVIELDGEEYLRYKPVRPDVALIRVSEADSKGNLSDADEAVRLEILSIAQAVHRVGGVVIAQAARLRDDHIPPRQVTVPGLLVDYVVIAEPELHRQTYAVAFDPVFTGRVRAPAQDIPRLPLTWRKVVARRAFMELPFGAVINLGIGVPEGVASVAHEEGQAENVILTVEVGGIGGVPAGGLNFGAVYNPDAILEHSQQFDLYYSGGLDLTCLGFAQTDSSGNVNVSKFKGRVAGCGGFIDIAQNTGHVVFCGSFTADGFQSVVSGGKLHILREGRQKKFVRQLEQITFSGDQAMKRGQKVLYVTERAVLVLENGRLVLTEVAPGVDLERDVLGQMEFRPVLSPDLKPMRDNLFL